MPVRPLYKSRGKAAAKLIAPALMSALLIGFAQHDADVLENPVAWLWIGAIVVVSAAALTDLRQREPAVVLAPEGLDDGRFWPWHCIRQMLLVERRAGPRRTYHLVLDTGDRDVSVELTDLRGSPREVFELVQRFWIENRHRMPAPGASPRQTAALPDRSPSRVTICSTCGVPVEPDDWECTRCHARLV